MERPNLVAKTDSGEVAPHLWWIRDGKSEHSAYCWCVAPMRELHFTLPRKEGLSYFYLDHSRKTLETEEEDAN